MTVILSQIPKEELSTLFEEASERAYRKVLNEKPTPPYPAKEFFTEKEAREFLGGISRSLFYKLKREDKFETYYCGEGRCLYSREGLIAYIKNNKPALK